MSNEGVRNILLTTLGFILLLSLPLLWFAWTETMLVGIFAGGVMAGALYCVLYRKSDPGDQSEFNNPDRKLNVNEKS